MENIDTRNYISHEEAKKMFHEGEEVWFVLEEEFDEGEEDEYSSCISLDCGDTDEDINVERRYFKD